MELAAGVAACSRAWLGIKSLWSRASPSQAGGTMEQSLPFSGRWDYGAEPPLFRPLGLTAQAAGPP